MSIMDDDFILELRIQFCHEALELLTVVEATLIELEKNYTEEKVSELKRKLHNMKGSSLAVGFDKISNVAHEVESMCVDRSLSSKIGDLFPLFDSMTAEFKEFLSTQDPTAILNFSKRAH